jgi:hypothetical protein
MLAASGKIDKRAYFGRRSTTLPKSGCEQSQQGSLFDHLISAGGQRWRHGQAQHAGGCVVDDELELSRLHHRQSPGFTLLGGAVSLFLCVSAAAQEGYYGVGHDKWHQGFYSKLKRNDGRGSCCNLMDW